MSWTVYSTYYGRPMLVGGETAASADRGVLWLAPGDHPGTVFATREEAETMIEDTMARATGTWAERVSYAVAKPGMRRVRRVAPKADA